MIEKFQVGSELHGYADTNIAPIFSTSTSYKIGDHVLYEVDNEAKLYKFTAAKSAGNWDSSVVTEVTSTGDTDTTLSIAGMAADAAKTGRGLYSSKNREGHTPAALTAYRVTEQVTAAGYPFNSYSFCYGSMLGSGWGTGLTLSSEGLYLVGKLSRLTPSTDYTTAFILRPEDHVFQLGRSNDRGQTWAWLDIGLAAYDGRDPATLALDNMGKYTGELTDSVMELPANSWAAWTQSADHDLAPLLGAAYPGTLVNGTTYIVRRIRVTASAARYELMRMGLPVEAVGYTISGSTAVTWRLTAVDATLSGSGQPADAAAVGAAIDGLSRDEIYVHTGHTGRGVYITATGEADATGKTLDSWGPLRINPGETCYAGDVTRGAGTCGAFYDAAMNRIGTLKAEDVTILQAGDDPWQAATDDTSRQWNVPPLYSFTAPAGARYVILNFWNTTASAYLPWKEIFLSNSPIYANDLMASISIPADHPAVKAHKSRRLCVIGPSTVMLDKTRRTNASLGVMSNKVFVGYQEYLAPFWAEVRSYGYSGGTWGQYTNSDSGGEYTSIYDGIVTGYTDDNGIQHGPKDLSGYDDFLLTPSTNGLAKSDYLIGEVGTYNKNTSPVSTYFGGMRGVIEYIQEQNPKARIYVTSRNRTTGSNGTGIRDKLEDLDSHLRELCDICGCQYVDLRGLGFTAGNVTSSHPIYSYDGVHQNNEGNAVQGLELRRQMVGI